MNKTILVGRLTKDAEIRRSGGENSTTTARFTMAVDRRRVQEGQQSADFIGCVAFGRTAEFLERFGHKGVKFVLEGRIQTGSYTNKDGQKVYTTDVIAESMEFAESKSNSSSVEGSAGEASDNGFVNIPEGIDEELPFV